MNKSLQIVNSSLKRIKEIELERGPYKIILSGEKDHLIVGEKAGNIEIINIRDWQVANSFKISTDYSIRDIVKL